MEGRARKGNVPPPKKKRTKLGSYFRPAKEGAFDERDAPLEKDGTDGNRRGETGDETQKPNSRKDRGNGSAKAQLSEEEGGTSCLGTRKKQRLSKNGEKKTFSSSSTKRPPFIQRGKSPHSSRALPREIGFEKDRLWRDVDKLGADGYDEWETNV